MEKYVEALIIQGFRVWYDKHIVPTDKWWPSILKHIAGCSIFMVFVSNDTPNSKYVKEELQTVKQVNAQHKRIPIFPIFLVEEKILADSLADLKYLLDLEGVSAWKFKKTDARYADLIKALEKKTHGTREESYERDAKTLGISNSPTEVDVYDVKTIKTNEREARSREWISTMRKKKTKSYPIDTVFQITEHALENLQALPIYETSPEKPSNLLTRPLDIKQAYITPMRLITGLITHLYEDWPPLVIGYGNLLRNLASDEKELGEFHYCIEFCWLAWGPSISTIESDLPNNEFVVVQAAFGDEANSLPLIMKKKTWQTAIKNIDRLRFSGGPVCLKNVIVVKPGKDRFFKALKHYPLFKDIYADDNEGTEVALYLPDEDPPFANGDIERLEGVGDIFYSTAYVWLMLEQGEKSKHGTSINKIDEDMKPGKIIPFFEHANLSTLKELNFLLHCLARKAIFHVLECENDPAYSEKGYYRFATALFPEQMVKIINEETEDLPAAKQTIVHDRLEITSPNEWRSPAAVLEFAKDLWVAVQNSYKPTIVK